MKTLFLSLVLTCFVALASSAQTRYQSRTTTVSRDGHDRTVSVTTTHARLGHPVIRQNSSAHAGWYYRNHRYYRYRPYWNHRNYRHYKHEEYREHHMY